jgi:site-specific recombinase XerD
MSRISDLRCFFRFCHDQGTTTLSPDQIDAPRTYRGEKPPRAIAWEMTQQFLSSIDRSTPTGERDYAVLFLIAHYGLRPGEITLLTLDSIDWEHHSLRIAQSKTRSALVLPMAPSAEQVLECYLRRGRPHTERGELFLTALTPIGPMNTTAINSMFKRRAEISGLPIKTASPYGLRHGFAMRLLEQGIGMKAIGDLLGHNCLESTSVYLRLHTEALRNVALPMPAGTMPTGGQS